MGLACSEDTTGKRPTFSLQYFGPEFTYVCVVPEILLFENFLVQWLVKKMHDEKGVGSNLGQLTKYSHSCVVIYMHYGTPHYQMYVKMLFYV